MNPTIPLGRVAGIKVGVHWSVLAIWWLLTWSLATVVLPESSPGSSELACWIVGLLASAAFLLTLLAHELSHSVVARQQGLAIEGITLWLFGGVARLGGEATTPRAELRIAIAGPLMSIALGLLLVGLAIGMETIGMSDLLVGATVWLAAINLLLAVFNLMPAFPLDGGRVLRAVLWAHHGDQLRATEQAARSGRVFGYLLVGAGLLELAVGYVVGLWTMFLGWFLLTAAAAESQGSTIRLLLQGVRVRDVMTAHPDVARTSTTVAALLHDQLLRERHSTFPLLDPDGRLAGMVTLEQIKRVPPHEREDTAVATIATPLADVPTADPDEELVELLTRLAAQGGRRALVLDHGELVGVVTPSDITRSLELATLRHDAAV